MRKSIFFVGIILFGISCKVQSGKQDNNILKQVYLDQKLYFNKNITDKEDYVSIINFARKSRMDVYKENGITSAELNDCIILEGYSPGWGRCYGLLISKRGTYVYNNESTQKWKLQLINLDKDNIEDTIGISSNIVSKVKAWDTLYLQKKSHEFGNSVCDGSEYIATRVYPDDNNNIKIETISFREFNP